MEKRNEISLYQKEYYINHKDFMKEKNKIYYEIKKKEINKRYKLYYSKHKKEICEERKIYYSKHKNKTHKEVEEEKELIINNDFIKVEKKFINLNFN